MENKIYTCKNCGGELHTGKKYCCIKCQNEYQAKVYIENWKLGKESGIKGKYQLSNNIRNYLLKKNNYKCEVCGWGKENNYTHKIPLEIHHIDGDYTNNKEDNLQVLCPNCHSLTNNYKNANINGRSARKKYYSD